MTGRLAGRGAIVIGGGQAPGETEGNGRAVARTFAREGARVLVVDRDPHAAEATAAAIRADGGEAYAHRADITVETDCAALPDAVRNTLGRLEILHHNVGVVPRGDTDSLSADAWRHGFEVNLTGMWLTCKYLIPLMRDAGGTVVLISSLAGGLAGPATVGYTTSKAAVNSLGRSLALENAPHGVRVNVIAPGMVDTPMGVDGPAREAEVPREQVAAQRSAMIPMGHQGTATDVANAALFLAGDESAFVTGAVLPVDGGSSLGLPRT